MQQHGSASASHVTLSTHFLHSTYDLQVGADSATGLPDATLSGAVVRMIGSSGAVVAEQQVSTLLDSQQMAQFEIPSGPYRLELVTTSAPGSPARTLWLTGARYDWSYTSDAANADVVAVSFGSVTSLGAPLPT